MALFLLAGFLFSVTSVKELLKMSAVISHFHEHQQSDNTIGFIRFIVMHYITDDGNEKDNERDEDLPFKSPTTLTNYSFSAIQSAIISYTFKTDTHAKYKRSVFDEFIYMINFSCMVWHPPQYS